MQLCTGRKPNAESRKPKAENRKTGQKLQTSGSKLTSNGSKAAIPKPELNQNLPHRREEPVSSIARERETKRAVVEINRIPLKRERYPWLPPL